jgi:hypothetical protein
MRRYTVPGDLLLAVEISPDRSNASCIALFMRDGCVEGIAFRGMKAARRLKLHNVAGLKAD